MAKYIVLIENLLFLLYSAEPQLRYHVS